LEDLFQGLDRSAGSAKLAKVSLAELSGMISTVVGRSGSSGTVVGNTLTWIFSKLNEPAMQEKLRRFGIETLDTRLQKKSGSEILREMAVKWSGMDSRSQQDLTQTLVGSRQSTRFQPLMNQYVEAQKLAIESQLNLNSAEEANIRILGSLKSQMAAVRAEWDRLVVNQGGAPGFFTGGDSITGRLAVGAGAVKNVLRVMNGDTGWLTSSRLKDLVPRHAVAPPAMIEDLPIPIPHPIKLIQDLAGAYRRAHDEHGWWTQPADILANLFPPTVAEKGEEYQKRAQTLGNRTEALNRRAQLFETISEMLPVAKGEERQSIIEAAASEMGDMGGAFKNKIAGGDVPGAQALLATAAKKSRQQAYEAALEAKMAKETRLTDLNLSRQNVTAEIANLEKSGAAQGELNQKKAEQKDLDEQIKRLNEDRTTDDAYAAEKASVEEVTVLTQQYVSLLREQQKLQEGIAQLAEQSTIGTAGGRLDAQIAALDSSIEQAGAAYERMDKRGSAGDLESRNAAKQLRQEVIELQAQRDALNSPRMQEVTRTFDARQIAARRAQEEASSYATGYTEAEKLLNQQREIERTINRIQAQPFRSENDRVRIKEMEIALWQNQEKIQTRIVDLARQEKQIRIDATREFQKSLLLAGPGEQLQRLYVGSLSHRAVGSGEFNALSPDLKRMYFELQGSSEGAKVREEERLLGGRRLTVEQEQAGDERARGRVAYSGAILGRNEAGRLSKLPGMPLPPLDPLVKTAKEVSGQFGLLATSTKNLTRAMDGLTQKIDSLSGQPNAPTAAATPPTPKLDIQSGYSLGSAPPAETQADKDAWKAMSDHLLGLDK
jgi:hypothetical protein